MHTLAVLLLAFASVGVAAGSTMEPPAEPVGATDALADASACAPPCGYIVPILDIRIPDKPPCGGGFLLAPGQRPADCEVLMADGDAVSYPGTFHLYWEISEDGHYLNDPTDPIVVAFGGTGGNPDFIDVSVEPPGFTLGTADLFDPQYMVTEGTAPDTQLWYRFEKPITVTWTRSGDPTTEDAAAIDAQQGVLKVYLRAKSDGSGQTFKEAFGVEEFRFDAWAAQDGAEHFNGPTQSTPVPVVLAIVALLAAGWRRR